MQCEKCGIEMTSNPSEWHFLREGFGWFVASCAGCCPGNLDGIECTKPHPGDERPTVTWELLPIRCKADHDIEAGDLLYATWFDHDDRIQTIGVRKERADPEHYHVGHAKEATRAGEIVPCDVFPAFAELFGQYVPAG